MTALLPATPCRAQTCGQDARAPGKCAAALYPAPPTHGRRVGRPARSRAEGGARDRGRPRPHAANPRERWPAGQATALLPATPRRVETCGRDARAPRKRAAALYPASRTHGQRVGRPARSRAEGADCLGARASPPARRNCRERWRTGRNDRASPGNIAARGNVRAGCPRSRAPPSAGLRLPPQHRVGRQRAGETPAHPRSAPRGNACGSGKCGGVIAAAARFGERLR